MPGLARKLLIFAAVDGLILQPAPPRNHKPTTEQAIKVSYKSNAIAPLLKDRREEDTAPPSLEAHGIVGLLNVSSTSFLISISSREQVAQIRGKPIYVITDVALIPLSSQADAEKAIVEARNTLQRRTKTSGDDDDDSTDTDTLADYDGRSLNETDSLPSSPPPEVEKSVKAGSSHKRRTSVAEDVIGKKGLYGRFADRWFSKSGWSDGGRRMQGMSSEEDLTRKQQPKSPESAIVDANSDEDAETSLEPVASNAEGDDATSLSPTEIPEAPNAPAGNTAISLLPKILRTTKLYFGSRSFFFSYDCDISRSFSKQSEISPSLPLFQSFDPLFFWNYHIAQPFAQAGQHSFILPLLQGFVGQRAFSVNNTSSSASNNTIAEAASNLEEAIVPQHDDIKHDTSQVTSDSDDNQKHFLLTLISRRSVKRAGLRYLRRGIDEEGSVANSVETEQILSSQSWDSEDKIFSFTQYRGSIPLFFSQTPFSFKPLPTLYGSEETNAVAFKLHFSALASRYGGVQVASLVDKHGSEAKIGEAYEKHANQLNEKGGIDGKGTKLGFEWFDFHNVCRGMKFENVSILMDTLGPTLSSYGWTIQQNDRLLQTQSGVLRTNCMDCLDRTNVVQSACGRSALEQQLADQNITIDLQHDPTTSWFNTLWADNGDAISKQYAGTAALKGDYTRTRRRNIGGALTDFGLTLNRYYNNIVNDYFAQAVIDYLLGRATDAIFAEFEADMKGQDYAVDLRKVRQNAIDTCAKIAVEAQEAEDLLAGWTLSCPAQANALRALPFEECVLLLTERALYLCRFDWGTEKVREFERVELERVRGLVRGVYITSTLAQRHMDEKTNVGLVVRYAVSGREGEEIRVNTRSLSNEKTKAGKGKKGDEIRFWAFKALPPRSSFASMEGQEEKPLDELETAKVVCEEIKRAADKVLQNPMSGEGKEVGSQQTGGDEGHEGLVIEEKDIVSLSDAKKSTGYLEQLGYSLKKLVWAS